MPRTECSRAIPRLANRRETPANTPLQRSAAPLLRGAAEPQDREAERDTLSAKGCCMTNREKPRGVEEFKRQLGGVRFRRFVEQVRGIAMTDGGALYPWHVRVLDVYDAGSSTPLPRVPAALLDLMRGAAPQPPRLTDEELPTWVGLEELGGACPVQGSGTMQLAGKPARWAWYFRARFEHWSISVVPEGEDPAQEPIRGPGFFHEEEYEYRAGEYDAGYMSEDTARYYIVRELARFRDTPRIVPS